MIGPLCSFWSATPFDCLVLGLYCEHISCWLIATDKLIRAEGNWNTNG